MGTRIAQQQFESVDIARQFEQAPKNVLAVLAQAVGDLLDDPGKIELEATAVVPDS